MQERRGVELDKKVWIGHRTVGEFSDIFRSHIQGNVLRIV